jgi:hypothetical protein
MYTCPVCGYDRLSEAPLNFTICPCCGTEFEYDDARATHAQLRTAWLRDGARWWSPVDSPPPDWDPYVHLNAMIADPPIWNAALNAQRANRSSPTGLERMTFGGRQPCPSMPDMLGTPPKQIAQAA